MKYDSIKPLITAFGFMAMFALFGAPSAPLATIVPTVGEDAGADPNTKKHAHYIEHRGHPVYHPVEIRVYRVTLWFNGSGNIIDFMEELLYIIPYPYHESER